MNEVVSVLNPALNLDWQWVQKIHLIKEVLGQSHGMGNHCSVPM